MASMDCGSLKQSRGTQRFDETGELWDGRNVGDDDSPGCQCGGDCVQGVPWCEHVEDNPVDGACLVGAGQLIGEIRHRDRPVLGSTIEEVGDVPAAMVANSRGVRRSGACL
ncbi:hypothetical protein [Brevibacterium sp. UCMA 11754]|uniref:hypothetical protein n=1 Tax=Brevibacterium sp. UCMA 11754 TaxID=2749198 RepID=UPI001F1EA4CB|nr:hypothetical protein [Brevibacterium sp. UCMA 11754]